MLGHRIGGMLTFAAMSHGVSGMQTACGTLGLARRNDAVQHDKHTLHESYRQDSSPTPLSHSCL